MGIALERTLEADEGEEILKTTGDEEEEEGNNDTDNGSKKRNVQDAGFDELLDVEDLELKKEIDELCREEGDMLNVKNEDEEEDPDIVEKKKSKAVPRNGAPASVPTRAALSSEKVIDLLDDEEEDGGSITRITIARIRGLYRESGVLAKLKIDPNVEFNALRVYSLHYLGPTYGLIMVACNGRVVVKAHQQQQTAADDSGVQLPKIGSIIVGVTQILIP